MIYRGIDKIHRSYEIVFIVESLDKVAKTFRGVRCQVKHVIESIPVEEPVDQDVVGYGSLEIRGILELDQPQVNGGSGSANGERCP